MKTIYLYIVMLSCLKGYGQNAHCEKIILITIDGIRWQEIFNGVDTAIVKHTAKSNTNKLDNINILAKTREQLMPFLWNFIAINGQIWGNKKLHNIVRVKNKIRLSYTGYTELLTGIVDNTIISNNAHCNKHKSLPEHIQNTIVHNNKVAAFATWHRFREIYNVERSAIPLTAGAFSNISYNGNDSLTTINDVQTYKNATAYLQLHSPTFMHIAFGEADEMAHQKNYTGYLHNLTVIDSLCNDLWEYIKTNPIYHDKTTIIITTDHGRGNTVKNWHKHGWSTKGSQYTWFAAIGNCILPKGEQKNTSTVYTQQIAPTMANLLGMLYFTKDDSLLTALIN